MINASDFEVVTYAHNVDNKAEIRKITLDMYRTDPAFNVINLR